MGLKFKVRVYLGDELIPEESIKKFFVKLNKKYDFSNEKGINKYIKEQLRKKGN